MMYVALYRARFDGRVWDQAVDLFSGRGGYAHAELIFSDGLSRTSTSMDKPPGPRSKWIDYPPHQAANGWMLDRREPVDTADGRWLLVPLDLIRLDDEWAIRRWTSNRIAERGGYDWGAVTRFVWPWSKESRDDWMCSEFVTAALRSCGFLVPGGKTARTGQAAADLTRPSHRVSPNHLARMLGVP